MRITGPMSKNHARGRKRLIHIVQAKKGACKTTVQDGVDGTLATGLNPTRTTTRLRQLLTTTRRGWAQTTQRWQSSKALAASPNVLIFMM